MSFPKDGSLHSALLAKSYCPFLAISNVSASTERRFEQEKKKHFKLGMVAHILYPSRTLWI